MFINILRYQEENYCSDQLFKLFQPIPEIILNDKILEKEKKNVKFCQDLPIESNITKATLTLDRNAKSNGFFNKCNLDSNFESHDKKIEFSSFKILKLIGSGAFGKVFLVS